MVDNEIKLMNIRRFQAFKIRFNAARIAFSRQHLGEKIALGILEDQKLTYGEDFSMTIPLFDGGSVTI